jgi:hypothetical protein
MYCCRIELLVYRKIDLKHIFRYIYYGKRGLECLAEKLCYLKFPEETVGFIIDLSGIEHRGIYTSCRATNAS